MAESILVVDDEPFIVRALRLVLEREGYEVHDADDGPAALATLRDVKPALCLCDIKLPSVNGFELCESIKGDEELKDTRVILLSAYQQESALSRGNRVGADDYLTKPFDCAELVARVRQILDGSAGCEGEAPPAEAAGQED